MRKETIEQVLKENKDYKGLYDVILDDGRSFPCRFHTCHLTNDPKFQDLESKNTWIVDVTPGFGRGWQERIEGEKIKRFNKYK